MILSDTSSAAFPTLSNCNLWLWEGRVKCVHSELPRATILQGDEKSVHFFFPTFCTGKFLCQPGLQGNQDSEGPSCQLLFCGAKSPSSHSVFLVKRSLPGGSREVGPPVSALLCYEYGTDGAKSICSVGTKTLTTQRSLLKTLLSSFIPSAFCALL